MKIKKKIDNNYHQGNNSASHFRDHIECFIDNSFNLININSVAYTIAFFKIH